MITAPPTPARTWHQRHEWRAYANTLFRYYSRKSNYATTFREDHNLIAAVNPEDRILYLNPNFPLPHPKHAQHVRFTPPGERNRILTNLHAYTAHEAAHVRFSSTKPHGLLGHVWNALEDERIERLISRHHNNLQLTEAFTYLGDTHLTRAFDELQRTPLEGILTWRWAHDHPTLTWECADPELWEVIQPIIETAWEEPDPTMVEEHARRILEALNLDSDAEAPPALRAPTVTAPHQPNANPEASKPPTGVTTDSLDRSGVPEAPEVMPEEPAQQVAFNVQQELESHAKDLAAALTITPKTTLRTPHSTRGRFDYNRYARGAQRHYQHKTTPTTKGTPRITLLHDASLSMGYAHQPGDAQHDAIKASVLLQRACELTRTPFELIAFGSTFKSLTEGTSNPEVIRARITHMPDLGGTLLHPALAAALEQPTPPGEQHVVIIYCDGEITPDDAASCKNLAEQHPNVFIIPILIGHHVDEHGFQLAFNRHLHVPNATGLPRLLKTWIASNLGK